MERQMVCGAFFHASSCDNGDDGDALDQMVVAFPSLDHMVDMAYILVGMVCILVLHIYMDMFCSLILHKYMVYLRLLHIDNLGHMAYILILHICMVVGMVYHLFLHNDMVVVAYMVYLLVLQNDMVVVAYMAYMVPSYTFYP